jgi:aconitate hydratase
MRRCRLPSETGRAEVALLADRIRPYLRSDIEVYDQPERYYDQVIEIDLSQLEPHTNGPYTRMQRTLSHLLLR